MFDISNGTPTYVKSFATPFLGTRDEIGGVSVDPLTGNLFAVDAGVIAGHPVGYEFTRDGTILNMYASSVASFGNDIVFVNVPEPSTILITAVSWFFFTTMRRGRK